MRKKIIIFGALSLLLVAGGVYFFIVQQSKVDTSYLEIVEVDGKSYKTTGSIPLEDVSAQEESAAIFRLASIGDVAAAQFNISVNKNGKVLIQLFPTNETTRQAALDWLKDSGFSEISSENIIFVDATSP